jgi:Zn-dependent protease with chaperone function
MPGPGQLHRSTTRVLSLAMVAIGVALVARTLALGGGGIALGIVLGALFVAAGGARLFLQRRQERDS